MTRSVSQKMGVREGMQAYLENVPDSVLKDLNLPDLRIRAGLIGAFDYIHFFSVKQTELDARLPTLKLHLESSGMLWISWPKGKKLGSDLSLGKVIQIAYSHGLVESVALSINETWSGLKLTYPKKGKVYNNKYGELPKSVLRK
jgi:hypothetical protein